MGIGFWMALFPRGVAKFCGISGDDEALFSPG